MGTGQDSMPHADCIKYHVPIIPQSVKPSGLHAARQSLPTWCHREEILNMIANNKVRRPYLKSQRIYINEYLPSFRL